MFDVLFVTLVFIYFAVAATVDKWMALFCLGLKSELPQGFLDVPRAYTALTLGIAAGAAATLIGTRFIPWYAGLIVLVVVTLIATSRGQAHAFATYRAFWLAGIADADAPESAAWQQAQSVASDAELRDRVLASTRPR